MIRHSIIKRWDGFFTVDRLHKKMLLLYIINETNLTFGVVNHAVAYRPTDGRCLLLPLYDRTNCQNRPLDKSTLRHSSISVCKSTFQEGLNVQMPTDRRQTNQTGCRWSDDDRRLLSGLFIDFFHQRNQS